MRQIITGLLIILMLGTQAQDLISTGGDFFQMESGSISFTIGEPIIERVGSDNHTLTQGFQQATPGLTTDYKEFDEIDVNIYPNPTTDFVVVDLSEELSVNYQIFDLHGVMLAHDEITPLENKISFNKYIPSFYFLKLYSQELGSKTFQIVKK